MLKENTGIELPLQNVLRLFGDYVLLTRTFEEATRIMSCPYIQVDNHVLAILGWTPDYGSTTLFLDESIPLEHLRFLQLFLQSSHIWNATTTFCAVSHGII